MNDIRIYHALRSDDGNFLAEIQLEKQTGVAEIVTPELSSFAFVGGRREICDEVAAILGIDVGDVYLTNEDDTAILF